MATNAKKDDESATVVDDDKEVDAEELLREAKYGEVESSQETDETPEAETPAEESQDSEESAETGDQEGQTDEVATEESEESDKTPAVEEPSFVKEFPSISGDTEEEYRKNLELAYKNSTTEALRLKGVAEGRVEETSEETGPIDPRLLYIDRIVNQDIKKTYEVFRKEYPQVDDPEQYQKFVTEVSDLSTFYQEKKGVALTAEEVYPRAAANLGWEPSNKVDDGDKLAVALKDKAAAGKTVSATKPKIKSTVTDGEIAVAKQMWGAGMSDSKIREELEKVKV